MGEDLALVAESQGWTAEEAAAYVAAAEAIGAITEQVSRKRPDIYIGAVLAEEPGGAPTLYIKGPADEFIRELIESSAIEIVLADNQPFSFDELEARKLRVHRALVALGFRYVATSVNITGGGRIPAGVTLEPGLPSATKEILSAIPEDLRASVELTLHTEPIVRDFASEDR